eukprot:2533422-Rhodomonas_salina.1
MSRKCNLTNSAMQALENELREVKDRIQVLLNDLADLRRGAISASNEELFQMKLAYNKQLAELYKKENGLTDQLGARIYGGSGAAGAALPSQNDRRVATSGNEAARAEAIVKFEAKAKVKGGSESIESTATAKDDGDRTEEEGGDSGTKKQEGTALGPVRMGSDDAVQAKTVPGTAGVNGVGMVKQELALSDGTVSAQRAGAVEEPTTGAETRNERSDSCGS